MPDLFERVVDALALRRTARATRRGGAGLLARIGFPIPGPAGVAEAADLLSSC